MTTLHAGGKFGGGAYKVSGGPPRRRGPRVVNGLSSHMRVEVRRNGSIYHQEYSQGLPTTELLEQHAQGNGPHKTGTTMGFVPPTPASSRCWTSTSTPSPPTSRSSHT